MAISRTAVYEASGDIEKDEEEAAVKRLARINSALLRRTQSDINHLDLELTELLLNRHQGDNMQKLLQKLGVSSDTDNDTDDAAGRSKGLSKYIDVLDEHGNVVMKVRRDDPGSWTRWVNEGYLPDEDNGNVTKFQKPAHLPTPAPAAPDGADRMVDVYDKNKRRLEGKQVKLQDGIDDPKLEAIPKADGTVDYFKEKSRFITRS